MNRKNAKRRGVTTKALTLILAVVMVIGISVGATLAWLTDSTQKVENTFTVGNIDIELAETGATAGDGVDTKSYKMVPGATLDKDPKVTVKANSEACWLFVKIDKSSTLDTYISYAVAEGWTEVPNNTGVYYKEQAATTADVVYSVLANNKVTVNSAVTKDQMDALNAENAVQPTLSFTAYAIQSANLTDDSGAAVSTAVAAWNLVKPTA